MAYHDDLLEQAFFLIQKEPRKPKQASLRRAVSTAYYAVFHLLVGEAVANWRQANVRKVLSRAFDHGTMKAASNRFRNVQEMPFKGEHAAVVANLRFVAETFALLQERRLLADYDNAILWTRSEGLAQVESARRAFAAWQSIRNEPIAQEYLVSLLAKKRS